MTDPSDLSDHSTQQNHTVLLLDDEALIALDIAMQIEEMGHRVMGPFMDTKTALAALAHELPDAAILDYNLGDGQNSKSVADFLSSKGVPFSFVSGYSATHVIKSAGLPASKVLSKPVSARNLAAAVGEMLSFKS